MLSGYTAYSYASELIELFRVFSVFEDVGWLKGDFFPPVQFNNSVVGYFAIYEPLFEAWRSINSRKPDKLGV